MERDLKTCMTAELAPGLLAMSALQAGAYHVTAVERWLYLSLACKEILVKNQVDDARYDVIYKRPTDLALKSDVKICCNLLICDMFDEGKPDFPCTVYYFQRYFSFSVNI